MRGRATSVQQRGNGHVRVPARPCPPTVRGRRAECATSATWPIIGFPSRRNSQRPAQRSRRPREARLPAEPRKAQSAPRATRGNSPSAHASRGYGPRLSTVAFQALLRPSPHRRTPCRLQVDSILVCAPTVTTRSHGPLNGGPLTLRGHPVGGPSRDFEGILLRSREPSGFHKGGKRDGRSAHLGSSDPRPSRLDELANGIGSGTRAHPKGRPPPMPSTRSVSNPLRAQGPLAAVRLGQRHHTNFSRRAASPSIRKSNSPCRNRWMLVVP